MFVYENAFPVPLPVDNSNQRLIQVEDVDRNEDGYEKVFDVDRYPEVLKHPEEHPGDDKQADQLEQLGENVVPQVLFDEKMDKRHYMQIGDQENDQGKEPATTAMDKLIVADHRDNVGMYHDPVHIRQ